MNFLSSKELHSLMQKLLQNLSDCRIAENFLNTCSGLYQLSVEDLLSKRISILSISNSVYSSLTLVFSITEITFLTLEQHSFSASFSMISLISGTILSLSLQFSSINFIHLSALSEVEVDFFSESMSLMSGITLLKLMFSCLSISWMFCISSQLVARLAFLTSSSSWDISSRIGHRTSSNLSMMIFLKMSFWVVFSAGIKICCLKKLKMTYIQANASSLVQLDDFFLATVIRQVRISLMISYLSISSSLPSLNLSFISFLKLCRHSSALILKVFSLSPSIKSRSSSKSGRQTRRLMLLISLRLLIHLMRKSLTPGLMDFSLDLTMPMNYFRLKSCTFQEEDRAWFRTVWRCLSRKIAALLTYQSRSLILEIMCQKIWLNIFMILSYRDLAMQYNDFRAVKRILCSLSFRHSRIIDTISFAKRFVDSFEFFMPFTTEGSVYSPAFFLLLSEE